MSRIITTIEDEPIIENDDLSVYWKAKAAIDGDGSGPKRPGDTYISDTSLHLNGQPLNSDEDRYIVVPPAIIQGVKGVVLGCAAYVRNTVTGLSTYAVVGDIGPHKKLGEISIACARALGVDASPTRGGTDRHIIQYWIWPGQRAKVAGKEYQLQPSHG